MNNSKVVRGQRLQKILDFYQLRAAHLANAIGVEPSRVSLILNGHRDISKSTLEKVSKWKPEINTEWLMMGSGQMLKSGKKLDENEHLDAALVARFSNNLRAMLAYREMFETNLAPLIGVEPSFVTDLLSGLVEPSLSLLIRLRQVFEVPLDAMLYSDLSPELMGNLKNDDRTILLELRMAIENLTKRMEKIEQKQTQEEERERKEEGDSQETVKQP